jgi:UDP-glucose 4-epimerase
VHGDAGVAVIVQIDETLPQRPINPYGESKLMFEKMEMADENEAARPLARVHESPEWHE